MVVCKAQGLQATCSPCAERKEENEKKSFTFAIIVQRICEAEKGYFINIVLILWIYVYFTLWVIFTF